MATPAVHNNIRRLRFDAGEMTQQDLANQVGVTRQTIIAVGAARYAPSLELAFKIAVAFGNRSRKFSNIVDANSKIFSTARSGTESSLRRCAFAKHRSSARSPVTGE